MALFRRDTPAASDPAESAPRERRAAPAPPRGGASTLIAAGSKLAGTLAGTTDVIVDGELEGGITVSAAVVIGEGGKARGDIAARTVRVAGTVVGNVSGSDLIEILPSGAVEGNLNASRVVIAEGAFFKGQVEMSGDRAGSRSGARADEPAGARPTAPPAAKTADAAKAGDATKTADAVKSADVAKK